ncbi:uncharacterized protein LOC118193258 [Stegodyphus dumicola]|uniref:uncharacterized protein LOC118193258 n=1 Tax=Stegodyphus dumicola TaxID=202533 RepID=UPI0015AE2340|nr:uncharacterized protein LOC118193258 [Stegodyphus dumicola]
MVETGGCRWQKPQNWNLRYDPINTCNLKDRRAFYEEERMSQILHLYSLNMRYSKTDEICLFTRVKYYGPNDEVFYVDVGCNKASSEGNILLQLSQHFSWSQRRMNSPGDFGNLM